MLGESFADSFGTRRLRVRLIGNPSVQWREMVRLEPYLHGVALSRGRRPTLFLWYQSFLRSHKNHGTKETGRKEGCKLPTGPDHSRPLETIMATHNSTASARAGERPRSPFAAVYARPFPELEPDDSDAGDVWPVIRTDRPDTAHVRAPRFLDVAGDLVSAILIIAGGVFAYGFMPLA